MRASLIPLLLVVPLGPFVQSLVGDDLARTTSIGSHKIGETFQQWLSISHLDLSDICGKHDRKDKRMDFKHVCKTLSAIRDTGRGEFSIVISDQEFDFVFSNGMAEQVSTEYPNPNLQHQLEFLKTTYGPPTLADTVVYQNPYGARWDCVRASWNMPDGAAVFALESIRSVAGEPVHWLTVTFVSREWRQRSAAAGNDTNPYGR